MPLTEQQEAALPVLDWLIGGGRGTGRSVITAIAIIRTACRNPGVPVPLIDHGTTSRHYARDFMVPLIRDLLHHQLLPPYATYSLSPDGGGLVVTSPHSFEWDPDVDFLGEGPPGPFLEDEDEYRQFHPRRRRAPPPPPPPKPAFQRILEDIL